MLLSVFFDVADEDGDGLHDFIGLQLRNLRQVHQLAILELEDPGHLAENVFQDGFEGMVELDPFKA